MPTTSNAMRRYLVRSASFMSFSLNMKWNHLSAFRQGPEAPKHVPRIPISEIRSRQTDWRDALFRIEQADIDRLAHLEVTDRRRMNAVATIIGRVEKVRIIGA